MTSFEEVGKSSTKKEETPRNKPAAFKAVEGEGKTSEEKNLESREMPTDKEGGGKDMETKEVFDEESEKDTTCEAQPKGNTPAFFFQRSKKRTHTEYANHEVNHLGNVGTTHVFQEKWRGEGKREHYSTEGAHPAKEEEKGEEQGKACWRVTHSEEGKLAQV